MGTSRRSLLARAAVLLALSVPFSLPASDASPAEPPARPPDEGRRLDPERQLVALKAQVMSADYRGDLAELARLRDRAARLADDPKLGYLARYWAGFASWRLAINGTGMTPAELKAHMEKATADFDAAIRLRDDFADAYAAASMCHAWLAFVAKDPATTPRHAESSKRQGARAKELAPGNPRVLWMEGARLFYTPVDFGGNPQRAIEVYRQMAAASEGAAAPDSPLPDWGKPEALMSLANAHLGPATLDLAAAAAEAQEALRLAPEWHYVRDILIPMIEARRKQAGKPAGSGPS
jgi:hypothetical protein